LVTLLPGQNEKLIILYNYIAEGERNLQLTIRRLSKLSRYCFKSSNADAYKSRALSYSLMGKYDLATDELT